MALVDAPVSEVAVGAPPAPEGGDVFDGMVADAHEVAVALAAMEAHRWARAGSVRIPAQAVRLVSDLGSYGA